MARPQLKPTAEQTFIVPCNPGDNGSPYNFVRILAHSYDLQRRGEVEQACNVRYEAFQRLYELIPEEGETILDWEDDNSRAALMTINASSIDHFLIGDWEMSAAMSELLLELDPEDHLEATVRLAYTYLADKDFDSFDEVINDVSDKHADKSLLTLWSEFLRGGRMPEGEMIRLKRHFAPYYREFVAEEHPVDERYLKEIDSERPSQEALARELWLRTENLWQLFPDFIEALRRS